LGHDKVEQRGAELIELLHQFVCLADIVELFIRRMLNDYLREVLANMPLEPIRGTVADLDCQAESRVIKSLCKNSQYRQPNE
jgi:hypothetical protein